MPAFGRIAVADDRDNTFKLRKTPRGKKTTRKTRMWNDEEWFGDQGDDSSCVGFAWAHWLAASPVNQFADPQGIYTVARFLDEFTGEEYDGTTVRAGAKVLHTLGFIESYEWAWTLKDAIHSLLEVGPVVVGTDWHHGMAETDDKGFVQVTGDVLGGHAYLLSGIDTVKERVRIKNSWGREWGVKGRAWITFADMDKLLKADGECCLGVERKNVPR